MIQPASLVQVVPQELPLHTYGLHCDVCADTHMPVPLQAKPVCVPVLHVVMPQAVPLA